MVNKWSVVRRIKTKIMGIFTGFEKGSGGSYKYSEEKHTFIKVSDSASKDPNYGLNGPVWFPKGGYKYFDKALQREFHSLSEKKAFMREHKIAMQTPLHTGDLNKTEAGLGKRLYFFNK